MFTIERADATVYYKITLFNFKIYHCLIKTKPNQFASGYYVFK